MATGSSNLHVVFIPAMAPGHMIPLVQAARLFAARGVRSTIITTVHNALTIQPSIDGDIDRGYPLTVRTINFPASEVGLPIGIENMSACTTECWYHRHRKPRTNRNGWTCDHKHNH
ncbi:hypothetical protein HanHA300_Chr11g0423321 [Helianthus annuus]|nr:hypothetical protein HanHA300_Chr11g0423321 [Helianthus annuus]